ncbi:MAG: transposase [Candidatus Brocadia sp.]
MRNPFYGVRRMTEWLRKEGYKVNRIGVKWLMRQIDLYTLYPKPRLSNGSDFKYPLCIS